MESGDPTVLGSKWNNSLYVAAGKDPFILIEKAVAAAAQLSGGAQQRQDKRQPDSLNWFGWCTWDAYYSKVSARGNQAFILSQHSSSQVARSCPRWHCACIFVCMHRCNIQFTVHLLCWDQCKARCPCCVLCCKHQNSLSSTVLAPLSAIILVGLTTDADASRHGMQVFMKG